MGSGKGQTRRARTSTPAPQPLPVAGELKQKWAEFISDSELQMVSLYQYYLRKSSRKILYVDYERVVSELFQDAVAVGAIVLPSAHSVEDFEFKLDISQAGYTTQHRLMMRLTNRTGTSLQLLSPYYYLDPDVTMESANVVIFLEDMQKSIGCYF